MSAGLLLLFIVLLVGVAGAGTYWARGRNGRTPRRDRVAEAPYSVQYAVPQGQDPAAASAALRLAGFTAASDEVDSHLLRISLPEGPAQRETVRHVLADQTPHTLGELEPRQSDEPVRFVDEVR